MAEVIDGLLWRVSRVMTRRGAFIELAAWGRFVRVCLSLYLSVNYWQQRHQNARVSRLISQLARQNGKRIPSSTSSLN